MPQLDEVGIYMKGLWLLLLGKSEGFQWLDISAFGVWRSFTAILWCLPAMAVGWGAWRLYYLAGMPAGTATGMIFIVKLFLVDLATWILPLLLVVILAKPLGYDDMLGAIVVTTNWLSVPIFYVMAIPAAIRLLLPGGDDLSDLLSLIILMAVFTAIFRVLKIVAGNHTLLASALSALFILPSLMLGQGLQQALGLIPG